MSKIVKVEKNFGDFLVRYNDDKYIGIKDENNFKDILVVNEGDDFFIRQAGISVEDLKSNSQVFSNFSIELLAADSVPQSDPYHEQMVENQNKCTLTKVEDGVYRLVANGSLNSFPSSAMGQGAHEWVAIAIHTGEPTILGLKWNGYSLSSEDIAEAHSVGLGDGDIILWVKYDAGNRTSTLTKGNDTTSLSFLVN